MRVALQVDAADASRIKEVHISVSKEQVALMTLKEQCADLERKATSLQNKITNAGTWACGLQADLG
jgi:structural maintenance of chromosome 4